MKTVALILAAAMLCISMPPVFARTITTYEVEMLVTKGDDTKEENSTLTFSENSFKVVSKKNAKTAKEFKYSDVKAADYSYSKKPRWKTGVSVFLLVNPALGIPFFFIKSKEQWLTVRTETDYAVLKLEGDNYRQILAELETHGVKVETIREDNSKDDKKSDK